MSTEIDKVYKAIQALGITELNEEQQAHRLDIRARGTRRTMATHETWNPSLAVEAMAGIYRVCETDVPPEILTFDGPKDAWFWLRDRERTNEWISPDGGAGWCYWRYYYLFFHELFGIADGLQPYFDIDTSHAFEWWLYREAAIIAGPPLYWRYDQGDLEGNIQIRLHCEDGPAVEWPDGARHYFWRGTKVPGRWIETRATDTMDASEWRQITNMETRRVFSEIIGWGKLAKELNATKLKSDDFGTLWQIDNKEFGPPVHTVEVECPSSGRQYWLCVPETCKTPKEALAACAKLTVDEYDFEKET